MSDAFLAFLLFIVITLCVVIISKERQRRLKIEHEAQKRQKRLKEIEEEIRKTYIEMKQLKDISLHYEKQIRNSCGLDSKQECTLCKDNCLFSQLNTNVKEEQNNDIQLFN